MKKISEISISYRSTKLDNQIVRCSNEAYELLQKTWNRNTIELYEEFKIILLNRANQVLGIYHLSKGGVSGTIADAKIIFAVALKALASGIIMSHNHPSGSLKPSEADKLLTSELVKAGKLLQIDVLDHVILTARGYFSFADEGLITKDA